MEITWDDRKDAENRRKHEVSFPEATTVVLNPLSRYRRSAHPSGKRYEYIGHSDRSRLLYVVTVEEHESRVRLISAREAHANEKKAYQGIWKD